MSNPINHPGGRHFDGPDKTPAYVEGEPEKRKLAIVNESIDTHRKLIEFAGSVKAFLSHEFGEHLPRREGRRGCSIG